MQNGVTCGCGSAVDCFVGLMQLDELMTEMVRLAVTTSDEFLPQYLVGGGWMLTIDNAAPGIADLWCEYCRLVGTSAEEARGLQMLLNSIAVLRGESAVRCQPTDCRSITEIEREAGVLRVQLDRLESRAKELLEEMSRSRSQHGLSQTGSVALRSNRAQDGVQGEAIYEVHVPQFKALAQARSAEQAIDVVADQLVRVASAERLPAKSDCDFRVVFNRPDVTRF